MSVVEDYEGDDYEPEDYEPGTDDEGEERNWVYENTAEWMDGFSFPVVYRHSSSQHWCQQWWRHRYAVERLGTLWKAWEEMYQDPAQASSWWIYHFDAHFPALVSGSGPFRACDKNHVEEDMDDFMSDPVPDGWPMHQLAPR